MTISGIEHKIFDPMDGSLGHAGDELLDPSVVKRDGRWCMFAAGQAHGEGAPNIFSATLPQGSPLSASGWRPARDADGEMLPVAGSTRSAGWDGGGGRHCPSYVKGWDAGQGKWVERIYYAGAAASLSGPYSIGYLEWDGAQWIDQATPCFVANEEWERGSVYEPNPIWHDGLWRMWYVAGANRDDYLVQGYAESDDGLNWGGHTVFAPEGMKMFDFCVREREGKFDAVFSRVHAGKGKPPAETGLWWCRADKPSGRLSDWSRPIQIMNAEDKGWHGGPFKPSLAFGESGETAWVFFAGKYAPFVFTTGCLEIRLPANG